MRVGVLIMPSCPESHPPDSSGSGNRSPYVRRNLAALLHGCIDKRPRHMLNQHALGHLANEARVHRIRQLRHGRVPERSSSRGACHCWGGTHENEAPSSVRMVYRKAQSDSAAHGVADDDACAKVECLHERGDIVGEVVDAVSGRGTAGVAVTPLSQGEGVDGSGQTSEHPFEGLP
jgi:hypothetical protein